MPETNSTQGCIASRRVDELNDGTVYYKLALVDQPGLYIWPNQFWRSSGTLKVKDEVILEWKEADAPWLAEVSGHPVRIITRYRAPRLEGVSVDINVPKELLNQNVAVIKELSPHWYKEDSPAQMYEMKVKHRDGGPKCYNLMFRPNEVELRKDRMVRIYWAARNEETAEKIGLALCVDVLGDVQYRDEK